MTSKGSYRPRRTRIYGANYDIGERYYKKQLDDLDNKRGFGTRLTDDDFKPKVSFSQDTDDDRFKFTPTLRRKPLKFDDDDDELFNSTLKQHAHKYSVCDDSSFAENTKSDFLKRVMGTPARDTSFHSELDDQGSSFTARKFKLKSESYLADDSSAETSSRMKATRARLADLESEMLSQNEKQSEREKRKHNLRKLLNESTSEAFSALEDM